MKNKYLLNNFLAIIFLFTLNSAAMAEDITLVNPIADGYHIAAGGGNITIAEGSTINNGSIVICTAEGTTTIQSDFRVELGSVFGVFSGDPSETDVPEDYDLDDDNMPDYWEFDYFLTVNEDATDDHDGDGASNIYEYIYETDPSDSSTSPHLYNYDYDSSGRTYKIKQEKE